MARKNYIEYEIYVPGRTTKTKALQALRKRITDFYGGLTDTRHKNLGLWKLGGLTIKDEVTLWRVLSDRGREGDRFMKTIQKSLAELLEQDQILVVRRNVDQL